MHCPVVGKCSLQKKNPFINQIFCETFKYFLNNSVHPHKHYIYLLKMVRYIVHDREIPILAKYTVTVCKRGGANEPLLKLK